MATAKTELRALDKLKSDRGWKIVERVMQEEQMAAAMAIASSANMTEKEIDFRRGAIWAASQLLNLPDRLMARLENDIALEKLNEADLAKDDT